MIQERQRIPKIIAISADTCSNVVMNLLKHNFSKVFEKITLDNIKNLLKEDECKKQLKMSSNPFKQPESIEARIEIGLKQPKKISSIELRE